MWRFCHKILWSKELHVGLFRAIYLRIVNGFFRRSRPRPGFRSCWYRLFLVFLPPLFLNFLHSFAMFVEKLRQGFVSAKEKRQRWPSFWRSWPRWRSFRSFWRPFCCCGSCCCVFRFLFVQIWKNHFYSLWTIEECRNELFVHLWRLVDLSFVPFPPLMHGIVLVDEIIHVIIDFVLIFFIFNLLMNTLFKDEIFQVFHWRYLKCWRQTIVNFRGSMLGTNKAEEACGGRNYCRHKNWKQSSCK